MDELGVSLLVDGGGTKTNDVDRIIANLEQENASIASRGGSLPDDIDVDVDPDMDGDEYMDEGEVSERGASVFRTQVPVAAPAPAAPSISPERELIMKHELLFQIDRMRRKGGGGMGMDEPRQLTTANSLEDIRAEHDRLKHDRDVATSVAFQRKAFVTLVSGLEMLNTKFRIPKRLNLEGWSESVNDSFEKGECDDIFEELYEKYTSKGRWPPELKLLMSLGGSAVIVQISNTMLKNTCFEQVIKQNPGMAKDFAKAAMGTAMGMSETNNNSGGGGGLMDFIGGMFGGKPGGGPTPPAPSHTPLHHQAAPVPPMGTMRGPTNFDAMMHNLGAEAPTNRMETLSNASDSDLDEAVSFSGMSFSSRRGAGGKRVLNL